MAHFGCELGERLERQADEDGAAYAHGLYSHVDHSPFCGPRVGDGEVGALCRHHGGLDDIVVAVLSRRYKLHSFLFRESTRLVLRRELSCGEIDEAVGYPERAVRLPCWHVLIHA